jgi:hypothetical protein
MSNNLSVRIGIAILCVLLVLTAIVIIEFWPQNTVRENISLSRSYRLVYTLELNSTDPKEINLNWTGPGNITNFQTVTLLNYSVSPSWMITDENNNTIAHFLVNLPVGQNFNISMTALITINATQYGNSSSPHQYDTTSAIFKTYTQPEEYVESDNPLIIDMAHNITKNYSDPANASFAICEWVHNNLNNSGFSTTPHGALWALENRTGDCSEHAFLFVALCRATNIPARFIEGIVTWNINSTSWGNQTWANIGHDWAEVYLPSEGWVWIDPTSGNYGSNDGEHIALQVGQYCASLDGNYRYSYTGNVNVTEHFEIYPGE